MKRTGDAGISIVVIGNDGALLLRNPSKELWSVFKNTANVSYAGFAVEIAMIPGDISLICDLLNWTKVERHLTKSKLICAKNSINNYIAAVSRSSNDIGYINMPQHRINMR